MTSPFPAVLSRCFVVPFRGSARFRLGRRVAVGLGVFALLGPGLGPGLGLGIPAPAGAFERVGAIGLAAGEDRVGAAVVAPGGAFAYFGTETSPARLIKVDLGSFSRVAGLTLPEGEGVALSAVVAPAGDFAYFGVGSTQADDPARVVKVDLASFERVGAISVGPGEEQIAAAVIDPAGVFAYFGVTNVLGASRVLKIALDSFELVDELELEDGSLALTAAVMDPAGSFAYFAASSPPGSPGRVLKLDLASFEFVGSLVLDGGEEVLPAVAIDPAGAFAYVGTATAPGKVVQIDLATFSRVATLTLASGEIGVASLLVDPGTASAYVGTATVPGRVVRLDLATFARAEAITLDVGEDVLLRGVVGPSGGFAYFGTWTVPGQVVKVAIDAPALRFTPASLDFGDVAVGTSGGLQVAILSNLGSADATGLEFALVGAGFVSGAGTCGSVLFAGESCEVRIGFMPTAGGSVAGSLTVSTAEGPTAQLGLAGRGVLKQQVFTAIGLTADPEAGEFSDGNRFLEPGEQVLVEPTWRNDGALRNLLLGTASEFTGPAGPEYDLVFDAADYGEVEPGASASCAATGLCYEVSLGLAGGGRPALHWDAVFDETLSDDSARTWTLHVGDSFTDVPRTGLFYPAIETLLHHGVVSGCSESGFCPAGLPTRASIATPLLLAREGNGYEPPPCVEGEERFEDLPFDDPACAWVEELARRQVVSGCGSGLYCPGEAVTRAQMAVFLLRTFEGPAYLPPACQGWFADVPCPSLFADWIEELRHRGVTSGCATAPPAYCPTDPTPNDQTAAFIARTFGLVLDGM